MEERILDDEEGRKIKLKRTQSGGTDAVDELSPDAETGDIQGAEIEVEVPDEEYDEDLVGLTPSQLAELQEKMQQTLQKMKEDSAKLTADAEKLYAEKRYAEAEPLYAEALLNDPENEDARRGLWLSRTEDFTNDEAFFKEGAAEELASDEKALAFVLPAAGARLRGLQKQYAAEEAELRPAVEADMAKRREAFLANRRYYAIRLGIFAVLALLFAVGVAVSADNILRTASNLPLILVGVFGALTLIGLAVTAVFARKFYVANGYCRANEKLSSTEEGERLEALEKKLNALALILRTEE